VSARLPVSGFTIDSKPALSSHTIAIRAPDAPAASRRSGSSTLSVPNRSAVHATIQRPRTTVACLNAARRLPPAASIRDSRAGSASTTTSMPAAITPMALNVTPGPMPRATAPITGPSRAPAVAAAMAVPIIAPRRSGGAAPESQPIPPVQEKAPPTPCANRARSSSTIECASPNTTLVTASSERPATSSARGPTRAASAPAGSDAISVPAG
jgi:hypothetical protein